LKFLAHCDNNSIEGLSMYLQSFRGYSVLVLSGLLFLAGCGQSGPAEYSVTGSVTLDGQPIEQGEVQFIPADKQGTPQTGQIVNGKFECRVSEGQKRVEITATRESPTPAADGLPNFVSYIPAAYNSQSTLTAEVKAGGDNAFTFTLQSQGATP
jgi:hypothetical protein